MTGPCAAPLGVESFVAYQCRELDDAAESRLEEHLFACDTCARRLESLERLRKAVAALVRAGRVQGSVPGALLARVRRDGLRVREYRVRGDAVVPCMAVPEDDLVAVRLAGGFSATDVLDVSLELTDVATGEQRSMRVRDVVIDRESGDVVFVFPGEMIRAIPRTALRYDVHRGGEQDVLASFHLDHSPGDPRAP